MHALEVATHQPSSMAKDLAKAFNKPLYTFTLTSYPDSESSLKKPDYSPSQKDAVFFYVQQFYSMSSPLAGPVDQSLFQLLMGIRQLDDVSVSETIAVLPYLPYNRQDTKKGDHQFPMCDVVLGVLHQFGVNKIITIDLHNPSISNHTNMPIYAFESTDVWAQEIKKIYPTLDSVCIASPDEGGVERAQRVANALQVPCVTMIKHRTDSHTITIDSLTGDVQGKNVVIIDDILDTGNTAINASDFLLSHGATEVIGFFSHPVLSDKTAINRLQQSKLKKIFIGNTMFLNQVTFGDKFHIVDLCSYMVEQIQKMWLSGSPPSRG